MKALAAGTREAGSAGEPVTRVGHPRGPGRRAGLCHFTLPGNTTTFAAQRRRFRGRGFVRQRPRRIPQPRAASVPPEQEQRAGSFQRVCGSASFWSAVCGRCCGTGAAKTPTWCPFLLGTRCARKSCGEELGRSELFRSNSTAALECQAQFLCQARHQGRSPRRWHRTPEAQDCGVLLLERAGLSQCRMLLVRFGGEGRVGSFGTVAVPTLSSTEATLTKH